MSSDDQNDWIKYSNVDQSQIPLLQRRAAQPRVFFSVVLIAIGVLLFLGNLGILPIQSIWQFWPVINIVSGAWILSTRRNSSGRIWGTFAIAFGVLFLLLSLRILQIQTHDGSWLLSLLLIAGGFAALISVLDSGQRKEGARSTPAFRSYHDKQGNRLSDFAIFGAVKRRSESTAFEGGELNCVFGNIEMDLRRAIIPTDTKFVVLNVMAVFGAINIRVPEYWRVDVSGGGILGSFEDKTIPPNTGNLAPTLVIAGYSIFGSVEVED